MTDGPPFETDTDVVRLTLWVLLLTLATHAAAESFERGQIVPRVASLTDPTQTFALYLPQRYDEDAALPMLLIFDPRGRAEYAAEIFRPAAEEYGWILISSYDTRSDGPWEPNQRALQALWPEVVKRFHADPRRVSATGFSGGAFVAWLLATNTKQIAGVIACGGHLFGRLDTIGDKPLPFAWYGLTGETDFNNSAMREIATRLAKSKSRFRLEIFPGSHQWSDSAAATRAVGWLEVDAMKRGLRPVDTLIATRLLEDDLARAAALSGAGEWLEAYRTTEGALRSYEGVLDVDALRGRLEELRRDRRVRAAEAEEKRWDAHERSYLKEMNRVMTQVEQGSPVPYASLLLDLSIKPLMKRSKVPGEAGREAKRVLEGLFSRASFYSARMLREGKHWSALVTSLRIAAEIKPDAWWARYDLACAYARLGDSKSAARELATAARAGRITVAMVRADDDFAAIVERPEMQQVIAGLSRE